jgi:glycosyltransferase involved in cell wall biosynthesis
MRVSVVVPTYGRPNSLRKCLLALQSQDRPIDEIIVVARHDDKSSQETVRMLGSSGRLVVVDRPGLVTAMNAGVDTSSGDVVALTDDDAQPHPDWISRMLAAYASDPAIGAVGGRDWLYYDGQLQDGAKTVVGRISWFGRITGNHHLGAGHARDVDVLKGVNLSMRGDLLRKIRFDERLLGVGTEHHWELVVCLTLRRIGYRIVYDPAIAVDHYPQPRIEGRRRLDTFVHVRNATHNETFALLEHLSTSHLPACAFWAVVVGTTTAPGLAQVARSLLRSRDAQWSLFLGAQTGRVLGIRTFIRSTRQSRKQLAQMIASL